MTMEPDVDWLVTYLLYSTISGSHILWHGILILVTLENCNGSHFRNSSSHSWNRNKTQTSLPLKHCMYIQMSSLIKKIISQLIWNSVSEMMQTTSNTWSSQTLVTRTWFFSSWNERKLSRFMKKNRIILSDKKYVYMYLRKKYCFCFHYKVV